MRTGRYFWKLFLGNAVLLGLVLSASVWLILHELGQFHRDELSQHLATLAAALRPVVEDKLDTAHIADLDALAKEIGTTESQGIRVTFIDAEGVVLGESDANPERLGSHADRPEFIQALKDGRGAATRWSHTVAHEMKYAAVRVGPADAPKGVVRVSMAVNAIGLRTQAVRQFTWKIAWVALLAALALALGLARLWSKRLRRITEAARAISRGDLSVPVKIGGADEVAALATALDRMRIHLARQLSEIERQRRVLESLLGQLQEGVVVADADGTIVMVNPAAARLLSIITSTNHRADQFKGQSVEKCIRRHDLQRMLMGDLPGGIDALTERGTSAVRVEGSTREAQIDVETAKGTVSVLARVSDIVLPEPAHEGDADALADRPTVGRLLALTDITELTRTIRSKTDFVANASHELRTPLSAIRAAVETLLNLDAADQSGSRDRFLEVIDRHSMRLESMVADLLDLARTEQARNRYAPSALPLSKAFGELSRRWADAIQKKNQRWECPTDQALVGWANSELMRLILDNVVQNAIKFTPPGGTVRVSCHADGDRVAIQVADTGCGIAVEDQTRVFERFYQVAAARSGTGSRGAEERGTGLGLAIVRHAVAAMDGTIRLESKLGEGTCITITIPQAKQAAARA